MDKPEKGRSARRSCQDLAAEHGFAGSYRIATGSRPTVLRAWEKLGDRILASDTLFDQQDLPHRVAVIGLGPIGLEIGQALSRLGLEMTGFDAKPSLSATTDPAVIANAVAIFKQGFPIFPDANVTMESDTAGLNITHGNGKTSSVDAAVAAVGATPQLSCLMPTTSKKPKCRRTASP